MSTPHAAAIWHEFTHNYLRNPLVSEADKHLVLKQGIAAGTGGVMVERGVINHREAFFYISFEYAKQMIFTGINCRCKNCKSCAAWRAASIAGTFGTVIGEATRLRKEQ